MDPNQAAAFAVSERSIMHDARCTIHDLILSENTLPRTWFVGMFCLMPMAAVVRTGSMTSVLIPSSQGWETASASVSHTLGGR